MTKFNFQIQYPFELNQVLNLTFSSQENISNYTSMISDKDRFQNLINIIENHKLIFDELIGLESNEKFTLFIIRAELFESTPEPFIIEYQLEPEKMILNLIKEIVKLTLAHHSIRCIDEQQQEELLNSTIISITELIDQKSQTKFSTYRNYLHQISEKNSKKQEFEYDKEKVEELKISKEKNLFSIIEESYSKMY